MTINFTKLDSLIPTVVQDDESDKILIVKFMNATALAETQHTSHATFFSRTRQRLWTKSETSGNRLAVRRLLVDCDENTVLLRVTRQDDRLVCHTGTRSCFVRKIALEPAKL